MTILHHLAVLTTDLERARAFYRDAFGLQEIERPPFKIPGAWFAIGDRQIHITLHPQGTFRTKPVIDNNDGHFAIRVEDFEASVAKLVQYGLREDASDGDPKRLFVNRNSAAGYPQAYLLDPDWNVIEVNATKVDNSVR
jgi:catechol 2,3-dioxygenase-like lactoylglutathione lyase family enzyme